MGKSAATLEGFILENGRPGADLPGGTDGRRFCGELDIRIDSWGFWHYNAQPIRNKEMVCLFASMLVRDCQGRHWLVSPDEFGRIEVEDAPFVAHELFVRGTGTSQTVTILTNIDQPVTLGPETPLRLRPGPDGQWAPYARTETNLDIKIGPRLYADLMKLGCHAPVDGVRRFGVWSGGTFFPLDDDGAPQRKGRNRDRYDA